MNFRERTNREETITFNSKINLLLIVVMFAGFVFACSSGLPELRPGIFKKPYKTETHGRFVEKVYKFYNGPSTIFYTIFEIDGKPVRIPNGHVEFTSYCKVEGIDAVAFTVRGKPASAAGRYILQIKDGEQNMIRLCDYGKLGIWKGKVFSNCGLLWDAEKMIKTKDPSFKSMPENDRD